MSDFRSGRFNERTPMFFTRDGMPLFLEGLYHGCTGFLVSNGPSLKTLPLEQLYSPGFVSIGVNNGPSVFRPDFHVCGDQPGRFIKQIWLDPQVQKFVPISSFRSELWDNDSWDILSLGGRRVLVEDCPNVVGIHRNDYFNPETWLHEATFGWGNSGKNGGCRTVFLLAIKLMYVLGVRKLFIVGADFHMADGETGGYAFAQLRDRGAARMNNKAYAKISRRCGMLKPFFDAAGFQVYNATPNSGLTSFPYVPFADAIRLATSDMGNWRKPRTEDMYLTVDHPGKEGKSPAALITLPPKEQANYVRRKKEWDDRMVMYRDSNQRGLIPARFLNANRGFFELAKNAKKEESKTNAIIGEKEGVGAAGGSGVDDSVGLRESRSEDGVC